MAEVVNFNLAGILSNCNRQSKQKFHLFFFTYLFTLFLIQMHCILGDKYRAFSWTKKLYSGD
jgi:hypothetical protein